MCTGGWSGSDGSAKTAIGALRRCKWQAHDEMQQVLRDFNAGLRCAAIRCTLIRHFCYTRHALDCSRQTQRQTRVHHHLAEVKQ
jgi:hypothetical protein